MGVPRFAGPSVRLQMGDAGTEVDPVEDGRSRWILKMKRLRGSEFKVLKLEADTVVTPALQRGLNCEMMERRLAQ